MSFKAAELVDRFSELVQTSSDHQSAAFKRIDCVKNCTADSLVFIDDESQIPNLTPAVVVTHAKVAEQIAHLSCCVIVVSNVRLAQAKIKQAYQDYDSSDLEWADIHNSAIIHPTVVLGDGVRVGPGVVIGKNANIGAGTQIRANSVIEHGASLGVNCIVNAQVNIGYDCELGDRVNIHAGVVIGNEGFGFAQDANRDYHRIPHTGIVKIGNDVQIGANSNIDRGTYVATIIGDGVKLDSLCHVAHNVHIDTGTLFASQACIAGSTYIGKRVMASGQVGILDHLNIADNTVLVHRTGVTDSITKPGMYAGVPAKPFKEYVRTLGVSKRMDKLGAQVKELKQKLLESVS